MVVETTIYRVSPIGNQFITSLLWRLLIQPVYKFPLHVALLIYFVACRIPIIVHAADCYSQAYSFNL